MLQYGHDQSVRGDYRFPGRRIHSGSLIAYQPSEEAKKRVEELIRREKNEGLAPEETSELNHYMELEHILTLAKARARARQSNG